MVSRITQFNIEYEATTVAEHRSIGESSPAAAPHSASSNASPSFQGKRGSYARAVGSFVPRLTQKAMQKFGFSTAALLTDWPAIVGADLARFTTPQRLKWPRAPDSIGDSAGDEGGRAGATLHLHVDASRALDIQYKARQIIERINAYFGYRAVADLRIVQVPIAPAPISLPRDVVSAAATKSKSGSTPVADLGTITDDRLRAALERLQKGLARR